MDNREVWQLVIDDVDATLTGSPYRNDLKVEMIFRDNFGRQKYGVPLTVDLDRSVHPLEDSKQEALDLLAYLKQCIERGFDVDNNLSDCYYQVMEILETIHMVQLENQISLGK